MLVAGASPDYYNLRRCIMNKISIQELALQAVDTMIKEGYKPITAWWQYENNLDAIVKLHEQRGQHVLSEDTVSLYSKDAKGRYERGEISYSHFRFLANSAERFVEYSATGSWCKRKCGTKSSLTEYFDAVISEVRDDLDKNNSWCANTLARYYGAIRQHITWLIQEGFTDFSSVSAETIRSYFMHCAQKFCGYSLMFTKTCLKKLYACLKKKGFTTDAFEMVFAFHVRVDKRILPAVPKDEIAAVLSVIDRNTFIGKRDYAIILLGAVTGLREVDIANLKLTDIDWRKGEIRISQKKTNTPLALPLTKDVGKALQDYILNDRLMPVYKPEKLEDNLFLCAIGPHRGIRRSGVGRVYENHRIRAGFQSNNKFHALRRTMGRDMVIAGVPVETVAQVLGHRDTNSAKQYISLDSTHLKECSLDFTGIEPVQGVR